MENTKENENKDKDKQRHLKRGGHKKEEPQLKLKIAK